MEQSLFLTDLPLDLQKNIFAKCDCDAKVNLIKAGISPDLVIGKVKMLSEEVIAKIMKTVTREIIWLDPIEKYMYSDDRITVLDFAGLYPNFSPEDIFQ